jgi:hypothetical protein
VLKISRDEALIYKAALYKYIKETEPNLSNLARAERMLELATKENLNNLDINTISQIVKQKIEKQKEKLKNKGDDKKKKEVKEDKKVKKKK